MGTILGISAFYHDSAAALVVDGQVVAAAQEERFTRKKHDPSFPQSAVDYCLSAAGLNASELDYVAFYDKPFLKFDRLLETYLSFAPAGFRSFAASIPVWLRTKLHLPRELRRGLKDEYKKRFIFADHHESHAASAFFPSPFDEAAILTVDGVGEWATASFGSGQGHKIQLTHQLSFPHSLGLLYSAFTYFCGFRVNSGEYKLMGLAPYGEPRYADVIRAQLLNVRPDGSFWMDMRYFNYCQGLRMTNRRFARLFGGPARSPESPITQREMDLAASIQLVTEEILLKMVRHVHVQTGGQKNLCLAGGVALNCVANGRILREGPFEQIWIQPAAGDAGGALGVALFTWHQLLGNERHAQPDDAQQGSRLGPEYSDDQVQRFLVEQDVPHTHFDSDQALCDRVAELLDTGNVVGWVQGRMEFGPRALGGRSILGDARDRQMQTTMNLKIKFRESFRPFAPSVLDERVQDYFELGDGASSPYMLLVAGVRKERRTTPDPSSSAAQGLDQRNVCRSEVPAITHVDYSARVQTVDSVRNPLYHRLLSTFERRTGCPVVINTSFNIRGEPIVCSPPEAYRCFLATNMDALVLGHYLLLKSDQPNASAHETDRYLASFHLD